MADYAIVTGGGGTVVQNSTGKSIPADELNRDWIAYQAWLAVPNIPDAETSSLADFTADVEALINREAELELIEHRPEDGAGPLSTLSFETLRREAVAATAEGTPWAAGYPFLEAHHLRNRRQGDRGRARATPDRPGRRRHVCRGPRGPGWDHLAGGARARAHGPGPGGA